MENNASSHNSPPNMAKMWNNDTFFEDEKMDFYLFSSIYLTMVVLVGNTLNIKALVKLIKVTKTRNTEQNFLLLNLIVSEVSLSLLAMPIDLYNSITRGGLLDSFVCPLVGFIHTFFGMNSLFTITAMAVVRYLSVVRLERTWHNQTNVRYWSSKHIWHLWGLSFVFAAPPLMGLGQYQKDFSKLTCCPNWSTSSLVGASYNWILILLGFIFPTCIIIFSNIFIMKKLQKQTENVPLRKNTIPQFSFDNNDFERRRSHKRSSRGRQRSNTAIAKTMTIMTVSFYICWTPYAIRCMLAMFGIRLSVIPASLALLFAKLGVIINPLIYIFYNKELSAPKLKTAMLMKLVAGLHEDVIGNIGNTRNTSSNLATDSLSLNKGTSPRENNEDTVFSFAETFQGATKITLTPNGDSQLSPAKGLTKHRRSISSRSLDRHLPKQVRRCGSQDSDIYKFCLRQNHKRLHDRSDVSCGNRHASNLDVESSSVTETSSPYNGVAERITKERITRILEPPVLQATSLSCFVAASLLQNDQSITEIKPFSIENDDEVVACCGIDDISFIDEEENVDHEYPKNICVDTKVHNPNPSVLRHSISSIPRDATVLSEVGVVEDIVDQYDEKYFSVNFGEEIVEEMITSSFHGNPLNAKSAMAAYRLMIYRISLVAKHFSPFKCLQTEGQAMLLRNNADMVVSLHGAVFFQVKERGVDQILDSLSSDDQETARATIAKIRQSNRLQSKEYMPLKYKDLNTIQEKDDNTPAEVNFNQLLQKVGLTIKNDHTLQKLLSYVILFGSHSCGSTIDLTLKSYIDKTQSDLVTILQRYIFETYPDTISAAFFPLVMECLVDLRKLCTIKNQRQLAQISKQNLKRLICS